MYCCIKINEANGLKQLSATNISSEEPEPNNRYYSLCTAQWSAQLLSSAETAYSNKTKKTVGCTAAFNGVKTNFPEA